MKTGENPKIHKWDELETTLRKCEFRSYGNYYTSDFSLISLNHPKTLSILSS